MSTQAKRCARCWFHKPLEEFSRHPRSKDGRQSYCKECMREYHRELHARKKELREARRRARGVL